ncbi:MAG: GNAT family N-acetyltransferase [Ilumatobacteraceae bacterium]
MRLEAFTLTGRHVRLEPLLAAHAAELTAAADRDRATYGWTAVPEDEPAMTRYIEALLQDAERDTVVPFAQRRLSDGALVGCTRLMSLVWLPGRSLPAEAEIGGTWLAADAQRSAINSEAKLVLLTHAFEVWDVQRVAVCTDERNERSRTAIERLGASFEGVLRNHRVNAGHHTSPGPRNTAVYSILPDEWPAIRRRLQERLGV